MVTRPPVDDIDETALEVGPPKRTSAGLTAVVKSLKIAVGQMGVNRSRAARCCGVNQNDGFDCQGCAWPDPPTTGTRRSSARTAPRRWPRRPPSAVVGPEFFAEHSLDDLAARSPTTGSGSRAGSTHPMVRRDGAEPLQPIGWDDAFALVAEHLNGLDSPDEAALLHLGPHVERGRVPLPAVRPRVRHEQPARLLEHVPRVDLDGARGDDRHRQGQRVPAGRPRRRPDHHQRPEPGHQPPADAHLPCEMAKRNGARIIAINPLPEAGLTRFKNPQTRAG